MVGWLVGGWWLLVVVGGWWLLVVVGGFWWLLVVVGCWWLVVGWLVARKRENNNTQLHSQITNRTPPHKSYTTTPEVLLTLNLTLG